MPNYVVQPKTSPRGGILVLPAWWGLNDFFKDLSNRLCELGYSVLTLDWYDGTIAKTVPEAEELRRKIKREKTSKQILEALKQLQGAIGKKPAGLIGFSMGAHWALWLVEQRPQAFAATVLFYGTRGGDYGATRSAFLGHFAETDNYVSDSGRKKLEKALKASGYATVFHIYPKAQHWFFEKDRPEYNALGADLAWQRTVEFLKSNLV